jgi:hypothetical protein
MSRHDDPIPHDRQMETEAVSSDRPPHLNESNCRYCCGLGCSGPQSGDDDGGGGCGSDATSTVVGSDNDVGDLAEPLPVEEVYEPQPFGPEDPRTSERQPGGFTYRSEEDLRFHRFLRAQRSIFISSILNRNRDELDSLRNEATTRSHSSASSEHVARGPGRWGGHLGRCYSTRPPSRPFSQDTSSAQCTVSGLSGSVIIASNYSGRYDAAESKWPLGSPEPPQSLRRALQRGLVCALIFL